MLKEVLVRKGLTRRESDVAEMISKGLTNKEVADRLFVCEKTVKFHLTNIYKKMDIKSRAQLIVWCIPHLDFKNDDFKTPAQNAIKDPTAEFTIPFGRSRVGTA